MTTAFDRYKEEELTKFFDDIAKRPAVQKATIESWNMGVLNPLPSVSTLGMFGKHRADKSVEQQPDHQPPTSKNK